MTYGPPKPRPPEAEKPIDIQLRAAGVISDRVESFGKPPLAYRQIVVHDVRDISCRDLEALAELRGLRVINPEEPEPDKAIFRDCVAHSADPKLGAELADLASEISPVVEEKPREPAPEYPLAEIELRFRLDPEQWSTVRTAFLRKLRNRPPLSVASYTDALVEIARDYVKQTDIDDKPMRS